MELQQLDMRKWFGRVSSNYRNFLLPVIAYLHEACAVRLALAQGFRNLSASDSQLKIFVFIISNALVMSK